MNVKTLAFGSVVMVAIGVAGSDTAALSGGLVLAYLAAATWFGP